MLEGLLREVRMVREYYVRAAEAAWAELIRNWRRELVYGLLGAGLYLAVAIPVRGKVDWLTLVPLAVPLLIFGWHFVRGPALVYQQMKADLAGLRHSLEVLDQANAEVRGELDEARAEEERRANFRATVRGMTDRQRFEDLPRLSREPGNDEQRRVAAVNIVRGRCQQLTELMRERGFRSQATGWTRSCTSWTLRRR